MDIEKMTTKMSGDMGEDYSARFLKSRGYDIVCRNYHSRYGEIDIIAENEKYLLFAEVKTRSINSWGLPRDAVNAAKQRKIMRTALMFLAENEVDRQPRFDVIEVYINSKNDTHPTKMVHIKGAFEFNGDDDYAIL